MTSKLNAPAIARLRSAKVVALGSSLGEPGLVLAAGEGHLILRARLLDRLGPRLLDLLRLWLQLLSLCQSHQPLLQPSGECDLSWSKTASGHVTNPAHSWISEGNW